MFSVWVLYKRSLIIPTWTIKSKYFDMNVDILPLFDGLGPQSVWQITSSREMAQNLETRLVLNNL